MTTNLVNAVDHCLEQISAVFKGTELICPWLARRQVIQKEDTEERDQSGIAGVTDKKILRRGSVALAGTTDKDYLGEDQQWVAGSRIKIYVGR